MVPLLLHWCNCCCSVVGMTTTTAPAARATHCAPCDAIVATVPTEDPRLYVLMEYDTDGYTVSGIRHICWPRDERVGRLILARRAAAQPAVVELVEPPITKRGAGPSDRCCGYHRDRCVIGHAHVWQTWYENGQLMRTVDTYHCHQCGGTCIADEACCLIPPPFPYPDRSRAR